MPAAEYAAGTARMQFNALNKEIGKLRKVLCIMHPLHRSLECAVGASFSCMEMTKCTLVRAWSQTVC